MNYRKFRLHPIFLSGVALLLLNGCNKDSNRIGGNRQVSTITIEDLSRFSGVIHEGAGNINIVKGNDPRVVVSGESNIINQFRFTVSGNDLFIDSRDCYSAHDPINITITTPELDKMETSGSSNVFSADLFEADQLSVTLFGAGNISLRHNTRQNTKLRLEGSGNIILEGSGNTSELRIIGSGNFETFAYPVQECTAIIEGSGNCSVTVEDQLNVEITGSGNVFYKGNPVINTKISGSGSVINAN